MRDGSHGVIVWALGVLVAGWLTASGITSLAGAGASAAGKAVSAATSVASSAAEGAASASPDPMAYVTDTLLRGDGSAEVGDRSGTREEIGRILARSLEQEELQAADREYLTAVIARESGVPADEAEARIDQALESVRDAADEAAQAAETARKGGIFATFLVAAPLVISAAAAWWAATMGGKHRDEGTDLSHLTRW